MGYHDSCVNILSVTSVDDAAKRHCGAAFRARRFWETRLERQLAAQTGLNVDVGAEVNFQLLPQPALGVENLKLTQPSVISVDVAPTLEAQNATAFLRFWPSLWGDIRVQNLTLNQPTLRITRDGVGEQSAKIGPIALTDLFGAADGSKHKRQAMILCPLFRRLSALILPTDVCASSPLMGI